MPIHKSIATLALAFFVLFSNVMAAATDFDKGMEAYESGKFKAAMVEWNPLAERGLASAQFYLGVMYDDGKGVTENDETAVKWYTLAAEQGDAKAQHNLGWMYDNGKGVVENDETAVKW